MQNRLGSETSPYLKQHAANPVHWQPWDDAALAAARAAQKPILLSVGYSACHWCHVMAHESFEDEATAAVMNEHFVSIKVDREERPDLDKVYQTAHHVITQQTGGWPLTMFLDPDTLIPFFGGTYFPKTARYQLPGFTDLLLRIAATFTEKRGDLAEQGRQVLAVLERLNPDAKAGEQEDSALLAAAREQLATQYDPNHGGFGSAPKFPMPITVERLLRHWAYSGRTDPASDREALDIVMTTLTKMARGGIYDHVGGGFCRYSTDAQWLIPHFEKMLYDNGLLLTLYADALSISRDGLFEAVVRETVGWLMREMTSPDGGFFAALDADSEGEEGRFYVWRRDQVRKLLTEDEYLVVETLYGLDKPANFEGRWNLNRRDSWRSVIGRLSLEPNAANALLASARHKLFEAREQRVRPGLDDKVLTAWNALAIRGLARAATVLDEPAWIDAATRALDFMQHGLWRDGTLWATWQGSAPRFPGYLDDHANLLDATLELLAARWRDRDYAFALQLAEALIEGFEDREHGGFFFTSHAAQDTTERALFHRPKPTLDDATPPGNGIAARALDLLGHLAGEPRYIDAAARTLAWARTAMERYPAGHCALLAALEQHTNPQQFVILRGPVEEMRKWQARLAGGYRPWRHVFAIPYDSARVPAYLPRLIAAEQRARCVAFVCSGLKCSLPITSLEALEAELGGGKAQGKAPR